MTHELSRRHHDPRRLIRGFSAAVAIINTLLLVPAALRLFTGFEIIPGALHRHFDLLEEGNLVTAYSSLLLVLTFCAAVANFCCETPRDQSYPFRFVWLGVAFVALYLSLDEVAQIHESLQVEFHRWLQGRGAWGDWIGRYGRAWIILYLPAVLAVLWIFLSRSSRIFPKTGVTRRLGLGGVGLWTCSLVLDFFYTDIARSWGIWAFHLEVLVEEGFEIFGTTSLLLAIVWSGWPRWDRIRIGPGFIRWLAAIVFGINSVMLAPAVLRLFSAEPITGDEAVLSYLESEGNLFVWYASLLLALMAIAVVANVLLRRNSAADRSTLPLYVWGGFGLAALCLSIDEVAQFHELIAQTISIWLKDGGKVAEWVRAPGRNWIVLFSPVIAVVVIGFIGVMLRDFRRDPRLLGLTLSGIGLWTWVLVLEFFIADIAQTLGPEGYYLETILEEGSEIFGSACLLIAFVSQGAKQLQAQPVAELKPASNRGNTDTRFCS
ncbi:MAG: hypothetical protein HY695_35770 [Deltaproteobacteria bacterium]|nr:hypothetical protein [Deltaproteobacteria bacterium]